MSTVDPDDYIEQAEAIERVLTRLLGTGFRDNGREIVILPPPTENQTGS
jgi:hypothetical protein